MWRGNHTSSDQNTLLSPNLQMVVAFLHRCHKQLNQVSGVSIGCDPPYRFGTFSAERAACPVHQLPTVFVQQNEPKDQIGY